MDINWRCLYLSLERCLDLMAEYQYMFCGCSRQAERIGTDVDQYSQQEVFRRQGVFSNLWSLQVAPVYSEI